MRGGKKDALPGSVGAVARASSRALEILPCVRQLVCSSERKCLVLSSGAAGVEPHVKRPQLSLQSQPHLLKKFYLNVLSSFFGGGGGILEKTSWRVPNLSQEDGWHESQESRDGCQEILNTRHIKTSVEAHVYLLQPPSLGACSHPS